MRPALHRPTTNTLGIGGLVRVLILNSGRAAYGAVRRLRPVSDEIVVVDHQPSPLRVSRWVDRHLTLPDPMDPSVSPQGLVEELIRIRGDGEPMVVLCCKDAWVELLSAERERLDPHLLPTSETDPTILQSVLDKAGLVDLAGRAGVRTPPTAVDIQGIDGLRPPIVVKPARKHRLNRDVEALSFRLRVCEDRGSARRAAEVLTAIGSRFIAQEVVGGEAPVLHTAGIVAAGGEVLAIGTGQKVRQFPRRFGECAVGRTTHAPAVESAAVRLVRAAGLSGIAQIEFVEHEGELLLVEINPRLWSWHEIHARAGVDIASVAADLASGRGAPGATLRQDVTRDVRWTFAMMDLLHNVLLSREIGPIQFLRELIATDVEAFASGGDRRVSVRHTVDSIPYVMRQWADQGRTTRS